jgi:ribonuclease P protein component
VAFAVGRRAGNAVTRNRIRRRLRAVMRELASEPDAPVRSGAYLIGADASAATLPYQELKQIVQAAIRQVGPDPQGPR